MITQLLFEERPQEARLKSVERKHERLHQRARVTGKRPVRIKTASAGGNTGEIRAPLYSL